MIVTVLVCENGWTALYGPDGKRLAEYPPEVSGDQVELAVSNVPALDDVDDFPQTIDAAS